MDTETAIRENVKEELRKIIESCKWSINYHTERIEQEKIKLEAYERAIKS